MNPQVIIVGAGISGLTTAFWLTQKGVNCLVLEKEAKPGGTMKTEFQEGFLIEHGPNSALETTPLIRKLLEELDIKEEQVYARGVAEKNRYILKEGELYPLPMTPPSFVKCKLLSWGAKLRVFKEPFIDKAGKEESVAEFVLRRLGVEFLDYIINPFVAGVFAGNPEQLSVQAAFPKLYALEEKYGGLIKGTIKGTKERKKRKEEAKITSRMFSFKKGMGTLPSCIAQKLSGQIIYETEVKKVKKLPDGYEVEWNKNNTVKTIKTKTVILSVPAYISSYILEDISRNLASKLKQIYYPPLSVVTLGYSKEKVKRSLDGFGFLVPAKERQQILGTLFSSTIFPNRVPEGYVEFTTFVGGSRQPVLCQFTNQELVELVISELEKILSIEGNPEFSYIVKWERAIPQYNLGHLAIMENIEELEKKNPGLFISSNFRGGIGVSDCIISADKTVSKILASL